MKPTNNILEKYHISDYFTNMDIPMEMKRYEKGELLIRPMFPTENIILILQGTIHIYNIEEDGTMYSTTVREKCQVLGDVEFVNKQYASDYVEAASEILTIEIPMSYCRNHLSSDPKFLNFLLRSIVNKMEKTSYSVKYSSLEDKVVRYLESECEGGLLRDIGIVSNKLHISRRQLQRILKKFCEEGKLEKMGKGLYQYKE